jgi:hypothetical protein
MSGHMWKLLTSWVALEVTNESTRHAQYMSEPRRQVTYIYVDSISLSGCLWQDGNHQQCGDVKVNAALMFHHAVGVC